MDSTIDLMLSPNLTFLRCVHFLFCWVLLVVEGTDFKPHAPTWSTARSAKILIIGDTGDSLDYRTVLELGRRKANPELLALTIARGDGTSTRALQHIRSVTSWRRSHIPSDSTGLWSITTATPMHPLGRRFITGATSARPFSFSPSTSCLTCPLVAIISHPILSSVFLPTLLEYRYHTMQCRAMVAWCLMRWDETGIMAGALDTVVWPSIGARPVPGPSRLPSFFRALGLVGWEQYRRYFWLRAVHTVV